MQCAAKTAAKTVAVLLSGCGVFDGSEIHEATSVLIHLHSRKLAYDIFAPAVRQMHVVNHQTGTPAENEVRMVNVEAARIARGPTLNTEEWEKHVSAKHYSALILPGGFGAMKNLSNFAVAGTIGSVRPDVEGMIKYFFDNKRPIGACCIAPLIVAKVVGRYGSTITLGPTGTEFCNMGQLFGARVEECAVDSAIVDADHKLVCTPAYMCEGAGPSDIFGGIGEMVEKVRALME